MPPSDNCPATCPVVKQLRADLENSIIQRDCANLENRNLIEELNVERAKHRPKRLRLAVERRHLEVLRGME